MESVLLLEDGKVFYGEAFGAHGTTIGEVVFNTGMTGYQEIITDPSYKGQMVTMTYPHIGNYGVNPEDPESEKPHAEAFIVREYCDAVITVRMNHWDPICSVTAFWGFIRSTPVSSRVIFASTAP